MLRLNSRRKSATICAIASDTVALDAVFRWNDDDMVQLNICAFSLSMVQARDSPKRVDKTRIYTVADLEQRTFWKGRSRVSLKFAVLPNVLENEHNCTKQLKCIYC